MADPKKSFPIQIDTALFTNKTIRITHIGTCIEN